MTPAHQVRIITAPRGHLVWLIAEDSRGATQLNCLPMGGCYVAARQDDFSLDVLAFIIFRRRAWSHVDQICSYVRRVAVVGEGGAHFRIVGDYCGARRDFS